MVLKPEIVVALYLNYGVKIHTVEGALIEYIKQIFKKDVYVTHSRDVCTYSIHEAKYICTETNTLEKVEKQYIEIL